MKTHAQKDGNLNIDIPDRRLLNMYKRLTSFIKKFDSVLVAYSGGVDSSLVAFLSKKLVLRMNCLINYSQSMEKEEFDSAVEFCKTFKIPYKIIYGNELNDTNFRRNDRNRCYYCKKQLFTQIERIRKKEGYQVIFDGSNYDDRKDYRPGKKATIEMRVISPLLDCKFTKKDIRVISKILKLPTWDKPSMACLSSRIPYNTPISSGLLKKIGNAEKIIKSLGFIVVRARIHGDILRLEIGKNEEIDLKRLKRSVPILKKQGFKYIVLDIEGYRTGSMNE